ncbi:MAG: dinitrogenase iron-molybdenum cofactor biosynthesis protein [Desulfovibrionales bacterium]|nr:dinitrogenase iron-molybdenum cofactor biosynthesis protein [Desulfovibrionales bacterium]
MSSFIVAIPSQAPGGLEAGVDSHFGHCGMYTLVSVDAGKVAEVNVIPNIPHEQGGCLAPVNYLAGHDVKALISGGMGMRPLVGFHNVGIDVFFGNGAATVQDAVEAFIKGALPRFSEEFTCGGGASPHDCENH